MSSRTGLMICLTEILRMSSAVRKEKDAEAMAEVMGFLMSMMGWGSKAALRSAARVYKAGRR